ncbi:MAG: secretin N-terminal domain-containing protein [Pseudomonadota bacterium]
MRNSTLCKLRRTLSCISLFVGIFLLAGCADIIRESAQSQLRAGNYEKALQTYEDGLRRYPENTALLSGQVTAREAVFAKLMKAAASARAAGDDNTADAVLRRALSINPNDDRARNLRLDLERDRRKKSAISSVREMLAQGMHERAMLTIEMALKDAPRDPELLSLQREHELAARQLEMNSTHLAETRPITLDFKDGNLRMILDLMTRNSGVNFVIDKDVRPDVQTSVFLRQSRLEDALELITATNQLAYKVLDSATVLVYPKTAEKAKEYQDLVVRAFYLSSADVKQTAAMLKTMLKIRDPFVDEKLNLIMVRETPETIRLAERLIALQDIAEPEVMMEVEVLEVQRSSLTELGFKYPDSLTLTPIAPVGGFTLGNVGNLNRNSIGVTVPNVGINLHRDVGDVNILANPKIRARNREKAKILIGDKLPVVTTTGSVSNSGFISESVQYVDVGLKLDVEPNIYLNDEVAIKVGLEVSSLVREVKTASGSLVYQIGNRTAATVLRLHDGETQLLAGLISNDERMSASRVPGIGDLPLLGRLFSSQRDNGSRTEIVLSITPRIIHNIRRPDLNQTEFWSGTENTLRSRPLALPPVPPKTGDVKTGPDGKPIAAPAAGVAPPAGVAGVAPDAGATPQLPAAPFSLTLMAPADVKLGDTFIAYVNIKSDVAMRGMPVELMFSPGVLEAVDAEEGAFFKQDGAAFSKSKNLEQAAGRGSLAILRNVVEGVKGEGTVAAFRFKAIAPGIAELRLTSAKPISPEAISMPSLPEALKITVK